MYGVMFKGNYKEFVYKYYSGKEAKIFLRNEKIDVYINSKWDNSRKEREVECGLLKWYKSQALETISHRVEKLSYLLKVNYNNIRIKDQKTRWGSCSQKGNLNFNWRLIKAPQWVLDYVVIHELCHLKHLNHSKEFWNMVEEYCEEYKNAKDWLNNNAYKLLSNKILHNISSTIIGE